MIGQRSVSGRGEVKAKHFVLTGMEMSNDGNYKMRCPRHPHLERRIEGFGPLSGGCATKGYRHALTSKPSTNKRLSQLLPKSGSGVKITPKPQEASR